MDVWIETATGNIAMASAVSHIVVRQKDANSPWEVAISVTGGSASVVAAGLTTQADAKRVRNALALTLAKAKNEADPQLVCFDADTSTVTFDALSA